MRRATYVPGTPRDVLFDAPVPCFLLRHGSGTVLVDTGCNPAAATDPEGTWGGLARVMQPLHGPEEHVGSSLAAIGLQPDDIDLVVLSHLHADHAGCNGLFRRAEFVIQQAELDAAMAEDAAAQGYLRQEWDIGRPMRSISGEHDLFGDGAIRLLPLPGHTPGQMGVLASLPRDGRLLLAIDAMPLALMLKQDLMPRNMRDATQAAASVAAVRALAADGVQVICGHDPEQWAGLRHGQDHYA